MTAIIVSQIGAILTVASAGLIFCYRVLALWPGNMIVGTIVPVLWVGLVTAWVRQLRF
jgi:hypothetical protein